MTDADAALLGGQARPSPSVSQCFGFWIFGGPLFFASQIVFAFKYQISTYFEFKEPCSPWDFDLTTDCSNIVMWYVQTGLYAFLFLGTLGFWWKLSMKPTCGDILTFPFCFWVVLMVAETIALVNYQRVLSLVQVLIDFCGYPQWMLHLAKLDYLWNATETMKKVKLVLHVGAIVILLVMIGITDVELQANQAVGRMLIGVEANLLLALFVGLAPGVRHFVDINSAPSFLHLSHVSVGILCTFCATGIAAGISYTSQFSSCTRWSWDFDRCQSLAIAWSAQTAFAALGFLLFYSADVVTNSLMRDYAELSSYLLFLVVLLCLNVVNAVDSSSPWISTVIVVAANSFTFTNLLLSTIIGVEALRIRRSTLPGQSVNARMAFLSCGVVWLTCAILYICDVFTNSKELKGLVLMICVLRSVLELVVCLYFPYALCHLKSQTNIDEELSIT